MGCSFSIFFYVLPLLKGGGHNSWHKKHIGVITCATIPYFHSLLLGDDRLAIRHAPSRTPRSGRIHRELVNPLPPVNLVIARPHPLVSALLLKGRPRFMISTIDHAGAKTIISDPRTREVLVKIRRRIVSPTILHSRIMKTEGQ